MMCIFFYIYNFIEGILHLYRVFLKKRKIVFTLNLLTCSNICNF